MQLLQDLLAAATKLDKVKKLVDEERGGASRSTADSATRKINSNITSENDSSSTTTVGGDKQYFWGDRCGRFVQYRSSIQVYCSYSASASASQQWIYIGHVLPWSLFID